jgi:hypothetical protein
MMGSNIDIEAGILLKQESLQEYVLSLLGIGFPPIFWEYLMPDPPQK